VKGEREGKGEGKGEGGEGEGRSLPCQSKNRSRAPVRNCQVIPKNVIEMSFIVFREYTRAKSKTINELANLPQTELVRYFCCSYQRFMKNTNQ